MSLCVRMRCPGLRCQGQGLGCAITMTFGNDSKEPCTVCTSHDLNQSEPRFGYTVCWRHQSVPPTFIEQARNEYLALGYTQWDPKTPLTTTT